LDTLKTVLETVAATKRAIRQQSPITHQSVNI